jgi:hypothetical protein
VTTEPNNQHTKCRITAVGKRRDGGTRFWCLEHKSDATAKYGKRARQCRYAIVEPIRPEETLRLDVANYKGGIALWGAVPPIYDTTREALDRGVHVHARRSLNSKKKQIDRTYRAVELIGNDGKKDFLVSELDAIYYMVTSTFGYSMKYVACSLCGFAHLDKDWFSVHPHRSHLCAGCGKYFRDDDTAIGNPIMMAQGIFGGATHRVKPAKKNLEVRQSEFPNGIQIWGSNRALLWTATRSEEEGIHIHAPKNGGDEMLLDDTFATVIVDGEVLDPNMVRTLMAQKVLPHIARRVFDISCPECDEPHFDTGELAFTPHDLHVCANCAAEFRSKGRLRHTIGNPMVGVLARLAKTAPRTPQQHELGLLPETL